MATALEELLKRIASERATAPIPKAATPANLGPLDFNTDKAFQALNPQPNLPAITRPAGPDQGFVDQYAGPAPVRPVLKDPSLLEKISAVLMGVGGGPEAVAQIRQQRMEPIRQYERQQEQYQDRRARGIELSLRQSEQDADRANRMAEIQYQRELSRWERTTGIRDDAAKERYKHALEVQRQAAVFANEERRELAREQARRRDDARSIAGRLSDGPGAAPPQVARELGDYLANLTDSLSPAAAKWRNAQVRRYEQLVGGGGGRSVSNAAMRALANFNGALQEVIGASQRGDVRGERAARRKLDVMHGRLSQFPGQIEAGIGTGGWPYAKLRNGAPASAPQPQAQGPTRSIQQIRAAAQAAGISEQEAIQRAQAAGFTITQ